MEITAATAAATATATGHEGKQQAAAALPVVKQEG